MTDYNKEALQKHLSNKGKIEIRSKDKLDSKDSMSIYYTPGVAAVSSFLAKNPLQTNQYTWTSNNLAVISDGSAVLGLGNIGPEGALPVMEGKAMIFKEFAGIDAVPIVLNVHTKDQIVAVIKALAPSFGAINLEDIAAPLCFEIEDQLKQELTIPVMHDDQHGTAVVVLAGLINAMKITKKELNNMKMVVVGIGAAGTAIIKLIHEYAPNCQIIAVDSTGIIASNRPDLNKYKKKLLKITNSDNLDGSLENALTGANIFIGVSKPNLLNERLIKLMAADPIIFAMANPEPEIYPANAKAAGALIVATGRSDFPNQINNALAFPGIFRGALDNKVNKITEDHKIAAAEVIANLVENLAPDNIIPSIFNKELVTNIAKVII